MGIRIRSTGRFLPARILTNADLEKMVETSDEWIVTRTGIRTRHIADADMPTSELAVRAAQNALEAAGVAPAEVGLIIVGTVTPDMPFPNTASIVQHKLGVPPCTCFDLEAACSGLLYSLDTARSILLAHPEKRYALVIGAEKLSSVVDWHDRSTCVLFGDAAAAILLESSPEIPDDFMLCCRTLADGTYADILRIEAGGSRLPASEETVANRQHFIKMGGPKTFQLAVQSMTAACQELIEHSGVDPQQIRWAIPHQANERIIDAVATRLKLQERVYKNVVRYGNTSSASIGLCLDELNRNGQLERGDLLLAAAFGAGLTWAAALIRW